MEFCVLLFCFIFPAENSRALNGQYKSPKREWSTSLQMYLARECFFQDSVPQNTLGNAVQGFPFNLENSPQRTQSCLPPAISFLFLFFFLAIMLQIQIHIYINVSEYQRKTFMMKQIGESRHTQREKFKPWKREEHSSPARIFLLQMSLVNPTENGGIFPDTTLPCPTRPLHLFLRFLSRTLLCTDHLLSIHSPTCSSPHLSQHPQK